LEKKATPTFSVLESGSEDLGPKIFEFEIAWGHFDIAWQKLSHEVVFFSKLYGLREMGYLPHKTILQL